MPIAINACEGRALKKIMVVDDEEDLLSAIKTFLDNCNGKYTTILAESGRKCLELLQKETPDLILLDIMMPKMNGWTIFNIIMKNPLWKNIPIFFISASPDPSVKSTADLLSNKFIEKPFTPEELTDTIDTFFNTQ